MRYRIEVREEAKRDPQRLPGHVRPRMKRLVLSLAANPRPQAALELRDRPGYYRIRLDRWRLIYRVGDEVLLVAVVRSRLKTDPETCEGLPDA